MLDDDDFRAAAIAWCGRIARNPSGAVFAAKRAAVEGLALSLDEGLRLEGRLFVEANRSEAARDANRRVARPDPS